MQAVCFNRLILLNGRTETKHCNFYNRSLIINAQLSSWSCERRKELYAGSHGTFLPIAAFTSSRRKLILLLSNASSCGMGPARAISFDVAGALFCWRPTVFCVSGSNRSDGSNAVAERPSVLCCHGYIDCTGNYIETAYLFVNSLGWSISKARQIHAI